MGDLILQSTAVAVLLGIVLFLWRAGRERGYREGIGWTFLLTGFALLLFASILDITDDFDSLSRFVVIGDTPVQSFLEKFVGRLGGFVFIAIGLMRWIPTVREFAEARRRGERTAAALRDSEERYRLISELSPHALFVHAGGKVVYANPAMVRMIGAGSVDKLIGMDALELLHPDERAQVRQHRAEMTAEGAPLDFLEVRYCGMDGRDIYVDAAATQMRWEGRDSFMVVGRDITVQKQAEDALRGSEAHYRGIMDNVADGIATIDEAGIVQTFNATGERMFGYRADEVIGRNLSMLMPEPDRSGHDGYLRAHLETGERKILDQGPREVTARRKDGSTFPMELSVGDMFDGDKRRFIGAMRDVTERQRVLEALREREAQLRQIIDAVPHMIFARDREGRFLLVNQAVADAYGTTIEALTGALNSDFHPDPDELERYLHQDRQVMDSGEPFYISEQAFHDYQGRRRYVETYKVPYSAADMKEPAILGVSMDVTERREAADQLRQAQKMEAVGQLTGGLAHDFNNLLAVILGNLQLLERKLADDDELSELAGIAIDASRRGAALTQQLLAFARQQPLEPTIINLNRIIADTAELMTRTLGERYEVRPAPAGGLWNTLADSAQVQNALLNLVINASQAMPGGGPITIETANVDLDKQAVKQWNDIRPGRYVTLSVSDSGTGMPAEVIERAFDPFFTTKETGKGSGLGLSMVYGFARQSGGEVHIESRIGEGTRVTIYLPMAEGEEAVVPRESAPDDAAPGNETILVVEDDEDVRDVAVKILGNLGYNVVQAGDGPHAIRMAGGVPRIDLLFTDMVLPNGMNGGELAAELCRRRDHIKVLFTSGNVEFYPETELGSGGGSAFLRKPYLAEELASTLRGLLDGEGKPE